jgi:hypothetical protein
MLTVEVNPTMQLNGSLHHILLHQRMIKVHLLQKIPSTFRSRQGILYQRQLTNVGLHRFIDRRQVHVRYAKFASLDAIASMEAHDFTNSPLVKPTVAVLTSDGQSHYVGADPGFHQSYFSNDSFTSVKVHSL